MTVNLHLLPGSRKQLKKAKMEMTTQFCELKTCFSKSTAAPISWTRCPWRCLIWKAEEIRFGGGREREEMNISGKSIQWDLPEVLSLIWVSCEIFYLLYSVNMQNYITVISSQEEFSQIKKRNHAHEKE